jgi:tRNA 2-thiouridine synthesizing protein A
VKDVQPDETLDLKGIPCPQNSARALLKLEGMEGGSMLEIIVDDGEPIKNVPFSLEDEGHEIINKVKTDKIWKILVRKV